MKRFGKSEGRKAASTYVETFILVAIVIASGTMIYNVMYGYQSTTQGPSISISEALVRQSGSGTSDVAVERFLLSNTGTVAITSFSITTSKVSGSATFAANVFDQINLQSVTFTSSVSGNVVTITTTLMPGRSYTVTLTIYGSGLSVGSTISLLVNAVPASVTTQQVVVTQG